MGCFAGLLCRCRKAKQILWAQQGEFRWRGLGGLDIELEVNNFACDPDVEKKHFLKFKPCATDGYDPHNGMAARIGLGPFVFYGFNMVCFYWGLVILWVWLLLMLPKLI